MHFRLPHKVKALGQQWGTSVRRSGLVGVTLAAAAISGMADAAKPSVPTSREVRYVAPASWVVAPPASNETPPPEGAPLKVFYMDQQVHVETQGQSVYTAQRYQILKPEALSAGNLTLSWNPDGGSVAVHKVRIIRESGQVDVLASRKFDIIQRETGLEAAQITGTLTAALAVPGLRVGDILEFAVTIKANDAVLGGQAWGIFQFPLAGMPGTFRTAIAWPQARPVQFRTTPDLISPEPTMIGLEKHISLEQRDPATFVATEGAPARYNLRRMIQYSDFASWDEVSARLYPLFVTASAIPANSPLRAEVARIAAASADPAERARLALRLVQSDVRYIFVGLNGGNYRPMTTDESWSQRYGDCKAKTALLLGLLRELGIAAEAVLVATAGGDGTDLFLPSPAPFDHVLVRAVIGGKPYWLDGVRLGDTRLDVLATPQFRWALPLRSAGATLEQVPTIPPPLPFKIQTIDLDANAGPTKPATVKIAQYLRGDSAEQIRRVLAATSADEGERQIRDYLNSEEDWATITKASWRFDAAKSVLIVTGEGAAKQEQVWWDGPDTELRAGVPRAGFSPPEERKRPPEQDSTLPWVTSFPIYGCWVSNIRLPKPAAGHRWETKSRPIDQALGGMTYQRQLELRDGALRSVMVKRSNVAEITAAQAAAANAALAKFDNQIPSAFQRKLVRGYAYPPTVDADRVELIADIDWTAETTPCTL